MTDLDKLFVFMVEFAGVALIGGLIYGALRLAIIIDDKIKAHKAKVKMPHQEHLALQTPDGFVYLTFTWR
jgi:hypothetical protein